MYDHEFTHNINIKAIKSQSNVDKKKTPPLDVAGEGSGSDVGCHLVERASVLVGAVVRLHQPAGRQAEVAVGADFVDVEALDLEIAEQRPNGDVVVAFQHGRQVDTGGIREGAPEDDAEVALHPLAEPRRLAGVLVEPGGEDSHRVERLVGKEQGLPLAQLPVVEAGHNQLVVGVGVLVRVEQRLADVAWPPVDRHVAQCFHDSVGAIGDHHMEDATLLHPVAAASADTAAHALGQRTDPLCCQLGHVLDEIWCIAGTDGSDGIDMGSRHMQNHAVRTAEGRCIDLVSQGMQAAEQLKAYGVGRGEDAAAGADAHNKLP